MCHGFMAEYFGDKTARLAGRLTMNPIKHLDLFGSIVLPFLLIITNSGFVVGWAKPVPYNPNNLRDKRKGTLAVASAGILANIFIAIFFGVIMNIAGKIGGFSDSFYFITGLIVFVNLLLALFNLMPFAPLDGSKILFNILPVRFSNLEAFFEKYSLILFIIFIVFVWGHIFPVVLPIYDLLTGGAPLPF